jgi:hypothetical protein
MLMPVTVLGMKRFSHADPTRRLQLAVVHHTNHA